MEALNFLFWGNVIAVVIHIVEESLLGGNFVDKVREHFWPEYNWRKFFWFNSGCVFLTIVASVLFDAFGGIWVIFPLAWTIHYVFNGCFHYWWAIHYKEYSPGMLTSLNYFILFYIIIRVGMIPNLISANEVLIAAIIGCLMGLFTSFGTPIAGKLAAKKRTPLSNRSM